MKEKIRLLSKGNFEYKKPDIRLSESVIEESCEEGSVLNGEFTVESANDVEIRAMIFSSEQNMKLQEESFIGTRQVIHYTFDPGFMTIGDSQDGSFIIISNSGEITVPFRIRVCEPYCETGIGKINDLDGFSDLARDNWNEAQKVFVSDDFKRVLLPQKKYRGIYDAITRGNDVSLAMDEFLCAIRRKERCEISVSQEVIEFENVAAPFMEKLLIERSEWGHLRVKASTAGKCISLQKTEISGDDFLGSYYELEYRIDPPKGAFDEGSIVLETVSQRIEIPVKVYGETDESLKYSRRGSLRESWLNLNKKYCSYRLHLMSSLRWFTEAQEDLNGCLNNSDSPFFKVVEAHFRSLQGKQDEAQAILAGVNGRELRYKSAVAYCYYIYVTALVRDEDSYTDYARDTIEFYTRTELKNKWEPVVMANKLGLRRGKRVTLVYRDLRDYYERSTEIPGALFFTEALNLVNDDPALLHEMGSFETALLFWGVRKEALGREAAYRFAELVARMRVYRTECRDAMIELCNIYETRPILEAALNQLILGRNTDARWNKWYKLGIDSELKVPKLYEFYMESLDTDSINRAEAVLPAQALVYFQYNSKLSDRRKGFLYRYILDHREELGNTYRNYENIIKAFSEKQLLAGNIDEDLAVLYREYLGDSKPAPHIAKALPGVIFKNKAVLTEAVPETADQPEGRFAKVVVYNSETVDVREYPIVNGKAYVDIFLDDSSILLEDAAGFRYISSGALNLEKLFDHGRYLKYCYEYCPEDEMVLLSRSERALKYQMIDETTVAGFRKVLEGNSFSSEYRETILKNLVEFYYENYEGETLEKYIVNIDIDLLDRQERSRVIEYYIQRGLYDRAYEAVQKYGWEGIQEARFMRLCSRMIRKNDFAADRMLLTMSYKAFESGKYDETVLRYLVRHFNGSAESMMSIWKAAVEFEIPAHDLEERLLCVVLFSETLLYESGPVFVSYYNHTRKSDTLIRAYLAISAYRYLSGESTPVNGVFRIMEIELEQTGEVRDIICLALLKHLDRSLIHDGKYYDSIMNEAARFIDRGITLPFFRNLAGDVMVPAELVNVTYIVHKAHPEAVCKVKLEYEDGAEDRTLPMKHLFGEIFMREVRSFRGEDITFTITETLGSEAKEYPVKPLSEAERSFAQEHAEKGQYRDPDSGTSGRNTYDPDLKTGKDRVDDMILCLERKDLIGLHREIEDYDRRDDIVDRLFELD
ncbi:MAG: DUF5717 family protein [Lachnospiraceae bacterium]|nr:DUF5717 family protein [Lachnospiraceae bacterium]